jgi:hypothetical protein
VGNQPAAYVALASHSQASWPQLPLPPPLPPTHTRSQQPEGRQHVQQQRDLERSPKLVQSTALYQSRSIFTKEHTTVDVLLSFMPFYFLREKQVMNLISISCNNCAYTRVKYIFVMDLRSSKDVSKEKSFLRECRAKNYNPKLQKSFPRERNVSFLLKSHS